MRDYKPILKQAYNIGWSVIPVKIDKRPALDTWKPYQENQPSKDEMRDWLKVNYPGWAVITGAVSGLVIIDFDGEAGIRTMESLVVTPHVKTGSGGFHLYVKHPGHKVSTLNSKSKKELGEKWPGLDIRADGGYAVFCGSNQSGEYQWLRPMEPDSTDVLPADLRRYLGIDKPPPAGHEAPGKCTSSTEIERVDAQRLVDRYLAESVNGRNDAGFNLACQLRDNGYSQTEAESYMRDYARRVPSANAHGEIEPYGDRDALASLQQAYSKPARQPWQAKANGAAIAKAKRPEPKEFLDLIPEGSFLDFYSQYASAVTDAPMEFHLATGLSALSAMVENRVYFKAWGEDVFCNLWTVLLAPSGFFRKTTAMKLALKIVRRHSPGSVMANDFTREKLIELMAAHSSGVIPVWEFGALLQGMSRDYNSGLKEFLTEIYDSGDYVRQTRNAGPVEIKRSALSILAGSTIDWIIDRITSGDLRSGFLARFLYWPATKKNGWKGFGYTADTRLSDAMESFLTSLSWVSGQAEFPPDVIEMYNAWLKEHEAEVNEQLLPADLQGFYTRIGTYVLKFAVLYQLSICLSLEVDCEAMGYAIKLAEYLKSHLVRLMEDEIVVTKDGKELKTIRELVNRQPGIDRSTLLRNAHLTAQRFDRLVETLIQTGEVRAQKESTASKPKLVYYPE